MRTSVYKISHQINNAFTEYSHAPEMSREQLKDKVERLVVGVPGGDSTVLSALVDCLKEPFYILFVLHTPRGEGEPGRYQSPECTREEVVKFLRRFSSFLGQDARHDIWLHSQSSNGTIVWDRHNLIYAYGPISEYESALYTLGFSQGLPKIPLPHAHHYRSEYDQDAQLVLNTFEWQFSELSPEDEQ